MFYGYVSFAVFDKTINNLHSSKWDFFLIAMSMIFLENNEN